jgi:hypothetical protein
LVGGRVVGEGTRRIVIGGLVVEGWWEVLTIDGYIEFNVVWRTVWV